MSGGVRLQELLDRLFGERGHVHRQFQLGRADAFDPRKLALADAELGRHLAEGQAVGFPIRAKRCHALHCMRCNTV